MNREEALLRELQLWSVSERMQNNQLPVISGSTNPSAISPPQSRVESSIANSPVITSKLRVAEPKTIEVKAEIAPPLPDSLSLLERVNQCRACQLHTTRQQPLIGKGLDSASWLIITESPSTEEDLHNQVSFGSAGELLHNLLKAVEVIPFTDTYHTFLVKCHPSHNRPPTSQEFNSCRNHLLNEIQTLQPKVVVLMGRIVAKLLLEVDLPLVDLRNKIYEFHGTPTIVTHDLGGILRQPLEKSRVWRDFLTAKKLTNQCIQRADTVDKANT
ncbi:uracil-DNA glycosylase [Ferrovum sp. PN-J185]|uniref:uracil-DNA glycosylase n=1 Tax=Ferrovum sp. PN-J185 TaxID=1356306 RepID=UPI00079B45F5|nr:uracil-DNA glycosylase [Ferrovum sp. PN-J185]KXW56712.1 uracil DNA glycosylase superfamily protein [Ferrovum sp. PN-J185]MCC6067603.1 uracil-DNA glycosylase [Ferrovum sp. PN-J185]MDE1892037.1 uracil-DNA glycosylase [Betaproteobacteria bacterium]